VGKFLLTSVKVLLDGNDMSNYCFNIDTPEEADQVEVTGFNADRLREFLAGLKDQTITLQMLQDFATGGPHSVLNALWEAGSTFEIWIQPDMTQPTSATNPIFGGDAQMFSYNGLSGELNARSEISVTIKPATNAAFGWQNTDPS